MDVTPIVLDREKAEQLYRQYLKDRHYSKPLDQAIARVYRHIKRGRVVIKALESIVAAGLKESGPDAGLPKLALTNAAGEHCHLTPHSDGSAIMSSSPRPRYSDRRNTWRFAPHSFAFPPEVSRKWRHQAALPFIPSTVRPLRALASYHVLWEAEWTQRVPEDPLLLRHCGAGDMWLVIAAWDLTEVERIALEGFRVH
jgi:hypothetical protein